MDTNPQVNNVVFKVKRLMKTEVLLEQAPTMADDGLIRAWRAVESKTGSRPSQVIEIYSEWEGGSRDEAFLQSTFPSAKITYSFARPTRADGWEKAFQDAARTMQKAGERQKAQTQSQVQASASVQAPPAEQPSNQQHTGQLLPVLRQYDPQDAMTRSVVHRSIGAGLAVFLARVGPTPRNTIGIDYLTRQSIAGSGFAEPQFFDHASQNLRNGLQVGSQGVGSERSFAVTHPGGVGASALSLPDFYQQATRWLGSPKVFVAVHDPARLFVALPGSRTAGELRQAMENSTHWDAVTLSPACYHLDDLGLTLIAARQAPH